MARGGWVVAWSYVGELRLTAAFLEDNPRDLRHL